MATFHCQVKAGKSGSGGAHADYIERDGKYASKSKDDLEHRETGNLPKFAETSGEFWKAADKGEGEKKSPYREYEIALPRELTKEQRLELVREFVRQEIGDKYTYTFAIHNPPAMIDGGEQPHAHIMFSERIIDGIDRPAEQYFKRWNAKNPERGGCKKGNNEFKTAVTRAAELVQLRERFANLQNEHLARHGHTARVTHLSLKAQGIDREVEPHFGPKLAKELATAIQADRAAEQINHTTEVKHETRTRPNHQLRSEIVSLHDVPISDMAHVTDVEHFTNIAPLHLPSAQQIDLREWQADSEPVRGLDTEDRVKPVKTAQEASKPPKPPNPPPLDKQAALDLFKRIQLAMKQADITRSAARSAAVEAVNKVEQVRAQAEWRMKLAIEENKRLGDRPRLITGKWDKAHEAYKAQFTAAKADEAKALETKQELQKKADVLRVEPTGHEQLQAALEALKQPINAETVALIALGQQVNEERRQQEQQQRKEQQRQEQGHERQ
jgi:hypothetical protein